MTNKEKVNGDFLPVHGEPLYPFKHWQVKDPMVLTHIEIVVTQLSVPAEHSLMSNERDEKYIYISISIYKYGNVKAPSKYL